jgi:shikimate kinase
MTVQSGHPVVPPVRRPAGPSAARPTVASTEGAPAASSTRPVVVLVGPPGSGKSTVGRALARATGLAFRDTDVDIEAKAGKPIPDIFVIDGEPVFRAMETDAVIAALSSHGGILSLGGGSVLAEKNRAALAGHAVVFLSVTMPTGVKRTGLASNRPLLAGVNPRATYKALLDARLGLYQEVATLVVETDNLTVDEVVAAIVDGLGLA